MMTQELGPSQYRGGLKTIGCQPQQIRNQTFVEQRRPKHHIKMRIKVLNLQETKCRTFRDTLGAAINLGHHVYEGGKWIRRLAEPHPNNSGQA